MNEKDKTPAKASTNGKDSTTSVETLPLDLDELNHEIRDAGGELELPPEYEGSVGRTMFDTPTSKDGTVTVLMTKENIEKLPTQTMVRIKSVGDARSYLGVVVEGPFAEPDGLRADSTPLVAVTVKGGILMPKYHGRSQIEILAEELSDGATVPPRRRPLPNSPVFILNDEETSRVLQTEGELRIGMLEGNEKIEIRSSCKVKSVLPRHLGILGTTGGGKSTTVSGMLSQLQAAKSSVVLFDTEGEYTAINEPNDQTRMLQALKRRGMKAAGVENTHIYVLTGRSTRNPKHPSVTRFSLSFSDISPFAFKEILDLTDAQEHRFFQAYDICKAMLRDLGVFPRKANKEDAQALIELDEQDRGYPQMTLTHLIDVAKLCQYVTSKSDDDPWVLSDDFKGRQEQILTKIKASKPDHDGSWRALLARLWQVYRYSIFDTKDASKIDFAKLIAPGRVAIVDLSDTDSPQINNLVIAQLLRGIQERQDELYQEAEKAGNTPPLTMVLIEEAHEFLSSTRIKSMPTLFQQVARIARRGRKRWLGLGFITQLPQHLPDEVLGLINNWIIHKITDTGVVSRLKKVVGGIDDGLWGRLPTMAPGQGLVAMANLSRPVQTTIDPTPCKLLMAD